jgi:hypothetical protein
MPFPPHFTTQETEAADKRCIQASNLRHVAPTHLQKLAKIKSYWEELKASDITTRKKSQVSHSFIAFPCGSNEKPQLPALGTVARD